MWVPRGATRERRFRGTGVRGEAADRRAYRACLYRGSSACRKMLPLRGSRAHYDSSVVVLRARGPGASRLLPSALGL